MEQAWAEAEGSAGLDRSGHRRSLVEAGQKSLEGAEVPWWEEEEEQISPPHDGAWMGQIHSTDNLWERKKRLSDAQRGFVSPSV